jgi:Flp pilus assembly protein TadD
MPAAQVFTDANSGFTKLFQSTQTTEVITVDALIKKAAEEIKADNLQDAISLLEKANTAEPNNATASNDLGVLYQRTGEKEKSRKAHEKAVQLQPANKIFQKNLADLLYLEFFELEKALQIYVSLQAKSPQDIEILKAIASICLQLGNVSDARFFLERVLAFQPWDREAQISLSQLEGSTSK